MAARGLGKGLDALIPSTIEVKNEKVKILHILSIIGFIF